MESSRWRSVGTIVVLLTIAVFIAPRYLPLPAAGSDLNSCLAVLEPPQTAQTGVFIEPDDSYFPIISEIDGARCEINLSIYLLSDQRVMDSLAAAHDRGVRVRVQLEEDPFGGGWSSAENVTAWMNGVGIEWRWTPARFQFSHAKYMVIDRQAAIIMNQNLTESSFNGNREHGVVTTTPAIVSETLRIFEADWRDEPLDTSLEHVITSPENSRDVFLGLIASATSSIDLYAEVIRDDGFVAALGDAVDRGVRVRLIVNESGDALDQGYNVRLANLGVEIRFSGRLYVHTKTMIFDDDGVFIGSQNPTANSFDNNREVGLVLADPISLARCTVVFERDWTNGIPVSPKRASPHDISS